MKLLVIAPPSAHRNEVVRFLEARGADVEVSGAMGGSVGRCPAAVDAIVLMDGVGTGAEESERWDPEVPVIRWTGEDAAASDLDGAPGHARSGGVHPPMSSFDLRELAFRVAQAAHGTAPLPDQLNGSRPRVGERFRNGSGTGTGMDAA